MYDIDASSEIVIVWHPRSRKLDQKKPNSFKRNQTAIDSRRNHQTATLPSPPVSFRVLVHYNSHSFVTHIIETLNARSTDVVDVQQIIRKYTLKMRKLRNAAVTECYDTVRQETSILPVAS